MAATATVEAGQDLTAAWPDAARSRETRPDAGAPASPATDWEQRVAELSRELDAVRAELAFAKRQLELDRAIRERPAAPIRLVREHGDAAAHQLSGPKPSLPMLDVLGREEGSLRVDGHTIHLSPRHTEIVVLLAGNANGMTTEQLAVALYGETGRPASVRVELCRLRKIAPRIFNKGNRVKLEVEADFLIVQRLLRAGRALEAAQRYPGALLPGSEAPGIVDAREELDAWMRSAVMASDDPAALWAWLESGSGRDDALAWKRFLADLDFADPRRPLAVSRLARLRTALTVVR